MQVENGVYGCAGLLTAACDTLVLIALCIVQVRSSKMMITEGYCANNVIPLNLYHRLVK